MKRNFKKINNMHTSCAQDSRPLLKTYGLCVKEGHTKGRSSTGKGLKQVIQDLDKGVCIQC